MISPSAASPWPAVLLILGAGVLSAFQVGKVPLALSTLQGELGLGLAAASWLISLFGVVGAAIGAPMGLVVDRVGARRLLVAGLLVQGLASLLGGLVVSAPLLLVSRLVEGLGFLAVVVAAPALVVAVASPAQRDRAMALWATFMPVGLTAIMLAGPVLDRLGWAGLWRANAGLLLGYAVLAAWRVPALARRAEVRSVAADLSQTLAAPGPWLLGGLFGIFAGVFFAVFGFLPSLLGERLGVGTTAAGALTAVAVAASGVGNLACGQLLARGLEPLRILTAAFVVLALCSIGLFGRFLPAELAYGLCVVLAFFGGWIPVVLLDAAPRYAPRPDLVGATIGATVQGNNLGMILGPAAAGALASQLGWPAVSGLLVVFCGLALWLVRLLGRAHAER